MEQSIQVVGLRLHQKNLRRKIQSLKQIELKLIIKTIIIIMSLYKSIHGLYNLFDYAVLILYYDSMIGNFK
jgi:hypothetical protein